MGKRDRERFAQTGKVHRNGQIMDISETQKRVLVRAGTKGLQAMNTGNQIKTLSDSLHSGRLSPAKLCEALVDNAHREMKKGADKLRKQGKAVTVEALLEEYHKDISFQGLADEVGLTEQYFANLAKGELTNEN